MRRKEEKNTIIEICPVRNVIARFGNKWGPKYTWYIAIEKEQILGFIPIKQTSVSSLMINNYYIKGDNLTILDKLLSEILANINSDIELWATVHKRHVQSYKLKDFRTHIEWKNYERMLYF